MSMCISIAQARAKVVAMPLGRGIFPARSEENKIALLRCPRAFRLRMLAQSGCCASGARHSSHKFSHQTTPRGFRLRRLAQSVEAASSGDLGEALSTRSLHTTSRSSYDLVQILVGRPCGVPVGSSLGSPCMKILHPNDSTRGGCMKTLPGCSWELLVQGSGRKILVKVFYNSVWEDFVEIPVLQPSKKSLRDLLTSLWADLLKSCWNPPHEVLALRTWRCSALVLDCQFFCDAHRKFSSDDFVSSSILISIEGPAAAAERNV